MSGKRNEDQVNHPKHYNYGRIEVIDIIEDSRLNFSLGCAIKYILRAGKKDDIIQDLEKAKWYIEREITRLKGLKGMEKHIIDATQQLEIQLDG